MEIPLEIDPNEHLVRIILHSFHYSESKCKVRPEAFLPTPAEVDEISVLRYKYTNPNFIKAHGLKLAKSKARENSPCKFIGIVCLKDIEISKVSDASIEVKCQSKASPLDENDLRRFDSPITTKDPGLPMHADLKYSLIVESDKPMNQLWKQQILKPLCDLANDRRLFRDTNIETEDWVGDIILLDEG